MEKRNYSEITPQIKKLAAVCESDGFITSDLYEKYKVNRGLRDLKGKGVLTGLTEISEIEAKKVELLNAEDYASIRDNEVFAELVEDHANISFEDLQAKCDKMLLYAVKSGKYNAVNSTEDTTKTSKKQFTNPADTKKTKPSRYGKLFAKEND